MTKNELKEKTTQVNEIISRYLMNVSGEEKTVYEGMNYSLLAGGKRLRPLMMKECYELFGGISIEEIEPFMAAIEMIHTYSLVHDDLPAMDNDDYRRGKLTTHKKFGEDMGILVGDALLNNAFEVALRGIAQNGSGKKGLEALYVLANKAGCKGMIGGQVIDVETSGQPIELNKLLLIYEKKTSCLIEAAMMVGALMAGATREQVDIVEQIAHDVGVAFQIQDDILDVIGDEQVIGKPVHSDEKNNKTTYVTLCGIDEAKQAVERYTQRAQELLKSLPGNKDFLLGLVKYLIDREK